MYRDAGAGVLEIQEILGHENVQTTTIYTHTSGELVKSALDNVGALLK
jgi:site-specific recombinase XerD